MREIAAASDFDFVAAEPRRAAGASPKRGKARKKPAKALLSRLSALGRAATPFLAMMALVGLLTAIAVNAMYMQHGRHPAPLFGSTFKIESPKPPQRPASIDSLLGEKLPIRTPAPASATDAALTPPPVVVAREAAPAAALAAAPTAAPARKSHDAIGALIGGGKTAPSSARKTAPRAGGKKNPAAAPAPAKSMLLTQRALQKIGAPVKPDGHYDVRTRQAIETFQRENHLPATGELTAKTRHLLAARSGLPVE